MPQDTSKELQQILAAIPADFADPGADYRAVRAMFEPFHGHPISPDLEVELRPLGGVNCGLHSLGSATDSRWVFHCHGGAFVSTPLSQYHFYAEMIARQTGCRVLMPDYRLAPENPYPGAHDDCYNAWLGAVEDGMDPASAVMMGESCGGSLALGVLLRLRDEGRPLPACFVSLTGWFDLSVAGDPVPGHDPFLTPEWVRNRAQDYLQGQLALDDPLVSPAYAELSGLPPLLLQIGGCDAVAEGARRLARNAAEAGVQVTVEDWPGMVQGWHGLVNAGAPEAQAAWRNIRAYVERLLPP